MLRLFSSIFVALALFLSPIAMSAGATQAHAATAATQDMSDHCAGLGQPIEKSQSNTKHDMKPGCTVACAAIPATTPDAPARSLPLAACAVPAIASTLTGIAPEGATPPPRIS